MSCLCNKVYSEKDTRVKNHCQIRGKYRGCALSVQFSFILQVK